MNRSFQPCLCKYQAEQPWGYAVFEHVDAKSPYWHHRAVVNDPAEAVVAAENLSIVMICCRGCGQEMVREHGKAP